MSGHCFHNQFSAASSAQTALPSSIVQNRVTSDVCVALLFPSHYCQTHVVILGIFTDFIEQDVMSQRRGQGYPNFLNCREELPRCAEGPVLRKRNRESSTVSNPTFKCTQFPSQPCPVQCSFLFCPFQFALWNVLSFILLVFCFVLVFLYFWCIAILPLSSFQRLKFPFLSRRAVNLFSYQSQSLYTLSFFQCVIVVLSLIHHIISLAVQWPFSQLCAVSSILTHCRTLSYSLFFLLSNHVLVFLS